MTARPERDAGTAEPLLYSVEEAAAILGIGRTFMFRLVGTGEIESCKIGKLRRITGAAIHDYIARMLRQQAAELALGEETQGSQADDGA